ncbi:PAS domain S-box protein [Haloarchaeobius sp. DYHT-AS-18]|uniref:PAS domain S-box protein n=1 Tax=Haloarchaeobius sp. DYHT-AS-18 TaxID=3446117 RepID=UPI003EB92C04
MGETTDRNTEGGAVDGLARRTIPVLHVDDDPQLVSLVSTFLERTSDRLEVTSATSAEEGLELLRDGTFECVVSDYQMPEMNGLAFLAAVRDTSPDLPFILFTGKGSEEIASDAITAGVTDYLQKRGGTDQYTLLANRIENVVHQYRSQRALVEREERYRKLTETAPFAIHTVDTEGVIQFTNPAVEQVFGYTDAELVGESLLKLIPEAEQSAYRTVFDRFAAAKTTDEEPTVWDEMAIAGRHADGRDLDLDVSSFAFEHDGNVRLTFIFEDVTERTHREREFRSVFDRAFDAMVIANDDGTYVDVNPAACELFGLPEAELVGRSIDEFASPEYDFEAAWSEFRATERSRGTFDLVRDDGGRRTVEFASTCDIVPGKHLAVLREVSRTGTGS